MEQLLEILREIQPTVDYDHCDTLIDGHFLDSLDILALVAEVDAAFPHWQQNRYYCHLVPEAQRAENARQVYHTRQWVRDRDAAAQKQRRAEACARLWDKGCRTVKKLLHISAEP